MNNLITYFYDFLRIEYLIYLLALLGLLVVLCYAIDNLKSLVMIGKSIMEPYFQPQLKLSLVEKFGSWAVVTGCTDGIGQEYAKLLAENGINIVLISRSKEKLIKTANEIETNYKVKTKWIAADFSKGQEIYKHIQYELAGISVGILVNNVGRMYDYPEELSKVPENILWDIININIGATTMMTHMLIENMKANGKGAIVNLSSGSELTPLPYMAVYSASKLYVKNLTLALQYELAEFNITVQLVTPLYVVTKMNEYSSHVMRGGIFFPNVQTFTRSLFFTLDKSSETTGYWSHGVQYALMKLCPLWLRLKLSHRLSSLLRKQYWSDVRKREQQQQQSQLVDEIK